MDKFDWNHIHQNCDLNEVRDELWHHSRFFGLRFTYIIKMIEDEYYFESLLLFIMLIEQVLSSKTKKLDKSFDGLIELSFDGKKKETAQNIKNLRNKMVHRYLFKYYVKFDNSVEFPLSEMSNYEYIHFKLFLPIMSCFSDKYHYSTTMTIGEYSVYDLAKQFGINDNDLDKMLSVGIEPGMKLAEKQKQKKENEINLMRHLDNTSPVEYWQSVFKGLFKE
ncbi:MAG: hypothetical protein RBT45_02820 [Acholeplasmataceae bacterium]|jgi:hypothetical protein|nr:hypothetical protein [Acholeplasmataceae bacterium]